MRIFHIVDRITWDGADPLYVPRDYAADGFVHFSFAHQVESVANARYRGVPDLVVVEIEADSLEAPVRVEDSYGQGEEFPHVYGPIPTSAEVARHALTPRADGGWSFTPGAAAGPASRDR